MGCVCVCDLLYLASYLRPEWATAVASGVLAAVWSNDFVVVARAKTMVTVAVGSPRAARQGEQKSSHSRGVSGCGEMPCRWWLMRDATCAVTEAAYLCPMRLR